MCVEYMWLILILLCCLKTYLSFETWKHLLESRGYLIHLFLFLGGHLSTHCFRYLRHLSIFFSTLFFSLLFFMNNFCIAHVSFPQQNFERDINKNFGAFILSGWKTYQTCFCIHSQCRSKTFLGGSIWKACFYAYPQCRSSAYVGGVYMILILRV